MRVRRDGKEYEIGFERGETTTPLHEIGSDGKGTTVHFKPDSEVFGDNTFLMRNCAATPT